MTERVCDSKDHFHLCWDPLMTTCYKADETYIKIIVFIIKRKSFENKVKKRGGKRNPI
jgi:hypothetical protein